MVHLDRVRCPSRVEEIDQLLQQQANHLRPLQKGRCGHLPRRGLSLSSDLNDHSRRLVVLLQIGRPDWIAVAEPTNKLRRAFEACSRSIR